MFVIVHNNFVILGPMRWNRFRFENTIQEECEVSVTLPDRNDSLSPIIVSEEVKILPVQGTPNPEHNPKIEFLHGPFWDFSNDIATSSYIVQPYAIDAVKNMLKAECANERYKKENSGTKVTIQDVEVTVDTSRGSRDIFVQKYLLMGENDIVQWKFPECWLTLTKAELGLVVSTGAQHIQAQFDWEAEKVAEIEASETLEQLAQIVIVDPMQPNLPNLG